MRWVDAERLREIAAAERIAAAEGHQPRRKADYWPEESEPLSFLLGGFGPKATNRMASRKSTKMIVSIMKHPSFQSLNGLRLR
jgi:hypothetical protein